MTHSTAILLETISSSMNLFRPTLPADYQNNLIIPRLFHHHKVKHFDSKESLDQETNTLQQFQQLLDDVNLREELQTFVETFRIIRY